MFRGQAVTLLAIVWIFALSACEKKPPQGAEAQGADMASMEAPKARRTAPPPESRRAPARSAAEACAEGARPGSSYSKEQFEVTIKVPSSCKVGDAARAEIQVVPKSGYKMNLKFPSELSLKKGGDGVTLAKESFDKGDAKELTEATLRYEVTFTPTSAGTKVVQGELGFSVCTPKVCITEPDLCVAWEVVAQ